MTFKDLQKLVQSQQSGGARSVRIRGAADAYQVLTNREILEYRFLRIKFGEIISLSKFSIFI